MARGTQETSLRPQVAPLANGGSWIVVRLKLWADSESELPRVAAVDVDIVVKEGQTVVSITVICPVTHRSGLGLLRHPSGAS